MKSFDTGKLYFQRALDEQPGNFYALFGLADCYRGMNDPEKSLEFWNRILAKEPGNKVILTRAGDAYRTLGQVDKAREYYSKALEIDFDIYAALGLALIEKNSGHVETALASLTDLIAKEPKNQRLSLEAADCCDRLGRPREGVEILEKLHLRAVRNELTDTLLVRLKEHSG